MKLNTICFLVSLFLHHLCAMPTKNDDSYQNLPSAWNVDGLTALQQWTFKPSEFIITNIDEANQLWVTLNHTVPKRNPRYEFETYQFTPNKHQPLLYKMLLRYDIHPAERCIVEMYIKDSVGSNILNKNKVMQHTGMPVSEWLQMRLSSLAPGRKYQLGVRFSCFNFHAIYDDKYITISEVSLVKDTTTN